MAMQGRYFRPRDTTLKGTGYDSKLEQRLHVGPLSHAQHHGERVPYNWEHTYEPDFVLDHDGLQTLVECKGYFMDRDDCTKYIWVRKSLPEGKQLVFCFENPNKAIHFQAKRKDGSRMTHAEWAIKNNFEWYSEETIGDLINELTSLQTPSGSNVLGDAATLSEPESGELQALRGSRD